MSTTPSELVICRYYILPEMEDQFRDILARHWPTLKKLDLVDDFEPQYYKGADRDGVPFIIEIFAWTAEDANRAHHLPEVAAIWEGMAVCMSEKDGQPRWEFPHVKPYAVVHAHV